MIAMREREFVGLGFGLVGVRIEGLRRRRSTDGPRRHHHHHDGRGTTNRGRGSVAARAKPQESIDRLDDYSSQQGQKQTISSFVIQIST